MICPSKTHIGNTNCFVCMYVFGKRFNVFIFMALGMLALTVPLAVRGWGEGREGKKLMSQSSALLQLLH